MWRKIWEKHYGEIPVDKQGRTYEIHHIDGDRSNNDITNLLCISIDEHYEIHMSNGEFKAASLIAWRMKNPEKYMKAKELSRKRTSEIQKELVEKGLHHLQGGEIQRNTNIKRIKDGVHLFLDRQWHVDRNNKQVANGTHILLKRKDGTSIGGDSSKKRSKDGTHHFQDSKLQTELSHRARLVCSKKVLRTCPQTLETKTYNSVQEILLENPDYKTTIYRKISDNKMYKGYLWKYL
jgi:hypothetical protein